VEKDVDDQGVYANEVFYSSGISCGKLTPTMYGAVTPHCRDRLPADDPLRQAALRPVSYPVIRRARGELGDGVPRLKLKRWP